MKGKKANCSLQGQGVVGAAKAVVSFGVGVIAKREMMEKEKVGENLGKTGRKEFITETVMNLKCRWVEMVMGRD